MQFEVFGCKINIEKKAFKEKDKMPDDLRLALKIIEKYSSKIPPSKKKIESARRASQVKAKTAKEKVISAVELLKLQGEEITAYKVAKTAKVGYNTARKYLAEIGPSFGL